jgi:type I restriction enzyme S subunit
MRPKVGNEPAFLCYAIRTDGLQESIWQQVVGSAQPGLSSGFIKVVKLCLPPTDEQSAVVRYLDTQDRRINRLIRNKRWLIELLNEQKQAIIHRAVTCGLDPNVRLKPSGIEWLGDVPEQWCLRRVGLIFKERNQCGSNGLPILVVSLNTGVTVGNEEDEGGRPRRLIEDRSTYKLAIKGDVAYNMMRMWQGAVGVVPVDGLVSPAYIVAKPFPQINSRYFTFIFRTDACKGEINCSSRGIVSDRNRLYWEDFKNLYLPVPDKREQDQIVYFIDMETRRIDLTIFSCRHEIDLIREFRTRLISDVVTGKLDVRSVELPAMDEAEVLDDIEIGEETEAEELIESEEVANANN